MTEKYSENNHGENKYKKDTVIGSVNHFVAVSDFADHGLFHCGIYIYQITLVKRKRKYDYTTLQDVITVL